MPQGIVFLQSGETGEEIMGGEIVFGIGNTGGETSFHQIAFQPWPSFQNINAIFLTIEAA